MMRRIAKWWYHAVPWPIRREVGRAFWIAFVCPIFIAEGVIRGAIDGWADACEEWRKAVKRHAPSKDAKP